MISGDIINALVPLPFQVLGRKLKPFSIGHLVLLVWQESPFAKMLAGKRAKVTKLDLANAVFICSRSFEQCLEDLDKTEIIEELAQWGNDTADADFKERLHLFCQYLKHYYHWFDYWADGEPGVSSVPNVIWVLHTLQTSCGYSFEQAINTPFNRATLFYLVQAERESAGAIRLRTDDSRRADRQARAAADAFDKLVREGKVKLPHG